MVNLPADVSKYPKMAVLDRTNNLIKKRDCTGEGFDDQPEINLPDGELLVEEQDDVQLLESLRGRKWYASILSSFSLIFSKDLVKIFQYTPSLHATEALCDYMYQNLRVNLVLDLFPFAKKKRNTH